MAEVVGRANNLVIACGALAHELVALKDSNHWQELDIQCLPADLHNTPQKIVPRLRAKLHQLRPLYRHCFIAYGDCGTGGELDELLSEFDVERLPGAHCYEFYAGSKTFASLAEAELGTFYLTDFLTRHFDRIILQDLGLEKHPELLDIYFGNYTKLVFLDQSGAPELQDLARRAAQKLGLEYQHCYTGLEHMQAPIKLFLEQHEK